MANWEFRYVGLVLAVLVAWYALRAYHIRRMAEIEARELELDGWIKLLLGKVKFAWQCPDCGMSALTSEGVHAHQDEESSSCARLQQQRKAEVARDAADHERASMTAAVVGVGQDSWPALGASDEDGGEQ